ncbi:tyrosine-type recombinase/integrase [Rhizomonospora bruguierae]|uniref:tyrosine-type recombinase/integrase n=1 Tax=Rhizomonospora bruguierae TaxID=1581705 RepID=UPI0020BF60CF|nr:site-specific integrase [Micromonospora sp. NBRC 107566]
MFTIDLPSAADGRRRQMNRKGFVSQDAAQAAETEARKAYARADLAADGSLAAELEAWLGERELDVQQTTLGNYRDIVRCYIVPHLGSRQVYALSKRAIHDFYKTLLTRGGKHGGPLSRTTVRTVHRVLMKALKDLHIVVDGVREPRKEDRETAGRKGVWTAEQAARFLAHHTGHRLYAAWVLAIVAGMRRGELLGLKWERVDLDAGLLRVHWQRTATSSEGAIEKAPKGKSKRTVAIGPTAVTVLKAHQRRQEVEKETAADLYEDGGYVFCREDGRPYYPRYLTQEWERCCRAARVPVIALHDARHTSATTGADAGVPQHVMKDRLGHASRRTTDEVYTHVLDLSARKAAELMETAIFGPSERPPADNRRATATSHPTRRLAVVRRRMRKRA